MVFTSVFEAYLICHQGAILLKYFDSDAVCLHDRTGGADRQRKLQCNIFWGPLVTRRDLEIGL